MRLIAGLGNPESRYEGTRHNVGFDALRQLANDCGIALDGKKMKAVYGRGVIGGEKVILSMPQTYMNLSGESVREMADYFKLKPEDIIVIFDDIDLPVGQLRIRHGGSAGGHNGIKSIISCLGSDAFVRVRIGTGAKPKGWDLADYVLGHFDAAERKLIDDAAERAAEAVKVIIEEGIEPAMNQFNRKLAASDEN